MSKTVDLHTHTTASDGTFSPREMVVYAWKKGLAAVAITDHDTVAGVREGIQVGKELGVRVVPGIELSSELDHCEIHIVGLLIDPEDSGLTQLLERQHAKRLRRNECLLERLTQLSMPVPAEELVPAGELLTRTHIAEALVRHGHAGSVVEALDQYLRPGKPAWIEKDCPTPEECAQVIQGAGGLAFLAHLDQIDKGDPAHALALANRALNEGLDGVEVLYTTYTPEWEEAARGLVRQRGLLPSGGSDFHGTRKQNDLGSGFGNLAVPLEWLERMDRGR